MSPTSIVLRPPQKLVLEARATGRYVFFDWSKDGISYSSGTTFLPQFPEEFPHFFEIYVVDPTTIDDMGLYEVTVAPNAGQQSPDEIEFTVIAPGRRTLYYTVLFIV